MEIKITGNVKKIILICLLNFFIIQIHSQENIKLFIEPESCSGNYELDNLKIKCKITNDSYQIIKIFIKDYDDYHGLLEVPTSFFVNVYDKNGKRIHENVNPYITWNTNFTENPEDYVQLKPNESIIKIFPLKKMFMAKGIGEFISLNNGKYFIQVGLQQKINGEIVKVCSNIIEFKVQTKE